LAVIPEKVKAEQRETVLKFTSGKNVRIPEREVAVSVFLNQLERRKGGAFCGRAAIGDLLFCRRPFGRF
jgi:hypothetical protein